jgi:hypothetical protein
VNNSQLPAASVNGVFCYQRKRRADDWEDIQAVSLSNLRAGEGVKLEIKSAELLKLHRGLDSLYGTVARDGVPTGLHTYIRADEETVLSEIAEMLEVKSKQNRVGSIVDYMYANALTENSLIVEIKTPGTRLLTLGEYRNGVYGPSKELGGATQQLLHARQTLQEEYLGLARNTPSPGFNIFATKALLIVGWLPEDNNRRRSFEIYRNAQRGIEIVTFDEMIRKAELLLCRVELIVGGSRLRHPSFVREWGCV